MMRTMPRPLSRCTERASLRERRRSAGTIPHFIVRTAWLYDNQGESFAKKAIELAANHAEVRIVDDQRGSPTFVPHLAGAVARLAATDAFGTHHIAGSGGCSRLEFAGELYDRLGISTRLVAAKTADFPAAARRPSNSELTTSRQRTIELPPWREGVAEFASRARD